jgi:SAM-dependent methyltransferase
MTDRQTLDVYDQKATEYDQNFCANEQPDIQLLTFLEALPMQSTVLDLGCGPGRSAAKIAAQGHKVTATDASAAMVALAAQHKGVMARQESFDDLSGAALYDGIFANFSLLHAAPEDQPRHIQAIATALKPGGIFHIGMKTGTGMQRDTIGRRYTYVTKEGLEAMLRAAGLEPYQDWAGEGPGLDGTIAPWIIIHARKHD